MLVELFHVYLFFNKVSIETVVLRRWGVLQDNVVLSKCELATVKRFES